MSDTLVAAFVFGILAIPSFLLLARLLDRGVRGRLERAWGEVDPAIPPPRSRVSEEWVRALADLQPRVGDASQAELEALLKASGDNRPDALRRYRALRAALILGALLITAAAGALVDDPLVPGVLGLGAILATFAFGLPRLVLVRRARLRRRAVSRALPIALDLLAICLMAGLDVISATGRVASVLRPSHPTLASELRVTHQLAELRDSEFAWRQLADRLQMEEVHTIVGILIQASRIGSNVADALTEASDAYRRSARQRAEAQANRASFWMLFPTITCLFVASAIVLVGPVILQFLAGGGAELEQIRSDSLEELEEFRPDAPPLSP